MKNRLKSAESKTEALDRKQTSYKEQSITQQISQHTMSSLSHQYEFYNSLYTRATPCCWFVKDFPLVRPGNSSGHMYSAPGQVWKLECCNIQDECKAHNTAGQTYVQYNLLSSLAIPFEYPSFYPRSTPAVPNTSRKTLCCFRLELCVIQRYSMLDSIGHV